MPPPETIDLSQIRLTEIKSTRMSDRIAGVLNGVFAVYAGEGIEWEYVPQVVGQMTPQGPQFMVGAVLVATMPAPIPGQNARFVQVHPMDNWVDLDNTKTAKAIAQNLVQQLRAQRAEFLKLPANP